MTLYTNSAIIFTDRVESSSFEKGGILMESPNGLKMCGLIGSTKKFIDYYSTNIQEEVKKLVGEDIATLTWYFDADSIQQHQVGETHQRIANKAEQFIDAGAVCVAITDDWMREMLVDIAHVVGEDKVIFLGDAIAAVCQEHKCKRVALLGTTHLTYNEIFRKSFYGYELVTMSGGEVFTLDHLLQAEITSEELAALNRDWFRQVIGGMMKSGPIDALVYSQPRLRAVMTALNDDFAQYRELNQGQDFICVDAYEAHIRAIAQACTGNWKRPVLHPPD